MYLLVIDSYSKWPEVFEMKSTGSAATIDKLRYLCSRYGLPETLVTDNGTQFTSKEFKEFTTQNGITHLFSAPYHPMSNGQAERFVDTFKRTCRKLKGEEVVNRLDTFLTTYRITPNDSLPEGKSPAEMFLQRKFRTTFDLLRPKRRPIVVRDEEMEKRFNRRHGAKPRSFDVDAKVFARHRLSQPWRAGHIVSRKGVMYEVRFQDGRLGRFHANQLWDRTADDKEEDPLDVFNDAFGLAVREERYLNWRNVYHFPPMIIDQLTAHKMASLSPILAHFIPFHIFVCTQLDPINIPIFVRSIISSPNKYSLQFGLWVVTAGTLCQVESHHRASKTVYCKGCKIQDEEKSIANTGQHLSKA
uniref:Integrase catalytic domain-containing protein n=1 Tax=Globodera rostochiensis TaxID=31243 RepID=A0A914H730_GLORO